MTVTIRKASKSDLAVITEIYNQAVRTLPSTFDTKPKTLDEQKPWFEAHTERFPILVAEREGRIVGWAALSRWADRCAYEDTAENSVYVDENEQRSGIGRKLMLELLRVAKELKFHTVIARVGGPSEPSVRLHEALGFEPIGVMREVGFKFGRRWDVAIYQKML